MSAAYHALKNRIDQIINALYHDFYTNCAVAVQTFDVAPRTLQRRWNENDFQNIRLSINKTFTNDQKQTIQDYIHRLNDINQCARFRMIVKATNYFIRFENRTIEHLWLNRFLKRNPKFHLRKQKLLTVDWKSSHNLKNMTESFNKLKRIMKKKKIIEIDVWNMNETDFRIDCEWIQMIISLNKWKSFCLMNSDNRDYITSVKCISFANNVIPSLFIISEVHIFHK